MANKRAVSLMVSYVILISIVMIVSIGVFAWLRVSSNITPAIDCKQGTSLVIDDYACYNGSYAGFPSGIDLYLKNNGYFNIDGFILSVGNNTQRAPITYLLPDEVEQGLFRGHYFFPSVLTPGKTIAANFSNKNETGDTVDFKYIRIVQIQPFILTEEGKIICENAVIRQELENCNIDE